MVVGMPVLLFVFREIVKNPLGDDVFGADPVCVRRIAIHDDTLDEVVVHLMTVVMRLHLAGRQLFGAVKADHVDVELFHRCSILEQIRAYAQRGCLQRRWLSDRCRVNPALLTHHFPC